MDALNRADLARDAPFWRAAEEAERFFMAEAKVHHALRKLVGILDEAGIAYAAGGHGAQPIWLPARDRRYRR